MENGSNYFCPCLWDGEERKHSSAGYNLLRAGPVLGAVAQEQRAAQSARSAFVSAPWWKQGICVCRCESYTVQASLQIILHCLQS